MAYAHPLVSAFPLISEQISPAELSVVLRQLEEVLMAGEEGAIVEMGCYGGTTSLFIRRLLNEYAATREFHVYDSFEGLPPKHTQDQNAAGIDFTAGELAVSKRQFTKNFERARLRPPIIHKAWFANLTANDMPKPIAFAFLDGDFYDSILSSLELVWPHMSNRGVILVHDYNRETLPGVAKALHIFAARHADAPAWREEANIAIGKLKA